MKRARAKHAARSPHRGACLFAGLFILFGASILLSGCHDKQYLPSSCTGGVCDGESGVKQRRILAKALGRHKKISSLFQSHSVSPQMIDSLNLKADSVVADIGCGTGAFEVLLLERQTPFKKLYAVDINESGLSLLRDILKASNLPGRERMELIHSTVEDTMLPAGELDVVFLLNTPFFVPTKDEVELNMMTTAPRMCLASIRRALKPGGVFHVFDWKANEDPVDRAVRMRWALEQCGFRLKSSETIKLGDCPHNHFVLKADGKVSDIGRVQPPTNSPESPHQ